MSDEKQPRFPRRESAPDTSSERVDSPSAGRDISTGDAGALPPVSDGPAEPPATDEAFAPEVDGYQLIERLGQGGMGTVWRARQLSANREVAIKFLAGGAFGSSAARRRFEREVELAGQLQHAHIARLYHSGVHEGVYFYAMELVRGEHLDDYARRHGLSLSQRLQLMAKICRAVDHAHQHGVLHRDLKPSNILVDPAGEPHLLDFGLARATVPDGEPGVSVVGEAMGTLAYMAPEQAAGLIAQIDTRTDVYSLGAILFELLTGQLPHESGGTRFEHQRRIVDEEPRRPRRVDLRIDRELDSIVSKAIAKNSADRYSSADALAQDLTRYLQQEPIFARPLTLGYLLRKRIAKYRVRFALGAGSALVLAGLLLYGHLEIRAERNRAEQNAAQAAHSLYLTRLSVARQALEQNDHGKAQEVLARCEPAARRWEWHRLHYQADQSIAQFSAADVSIRKPIAITNERVVAIDDQEGIWVWSRETGQRTAHLTAWARSDAAALSPDGEVAAFSQPNALALVSTIGDERLRRFEKPEVMLRRIAFGPGSRYILALTESTLFVWDRQAGDAPIHRHDIAGRAEALAMSPEAKAVIYTVGDALWWLRLKDGKSHQLGKAPGRVRSLVWGAAGETLAAADRAGHVTVWRIDARQTPQLERIAQRRADATALAFGSRAKHLVIGAKNGDIQRWDITTNTVVSRYAGHQHQICGIDFVPDANEFITADAGGDVRLWRVTRSANGQRHIDLPGDAPVSAIAAAPNGRRFAAGMLSGQVHLRDIGSDRAPRVIHKGAEAVNDLAFNEKGTALAAACNRVLRVWSFEQGQPGKPANMPCEDRLSDVAWLRGNEALVTAAYGEGASLTLWQRTDAGEWHQARQLPGTLATAIGDQGRRLASLSPDRSELLVFDVAEWGVQHRLPITRPPGRAVALGPRGRYAAVVGSDHEVTLWDLSRSRPQQRWRTKPGTPTYTITFGPIGDRLLTTGTTVQAWDARTGTNVLDAAPEPGMHLFSSAFSPSGRTLMTGGEGVVILWKSNRPRLAATP